MQVSISSLQSTFLVSPVVAVHHLSQHRLWLCHLLLCLRIGVQRPPSVFAGLASETLKSEADTLEGICNGKKKQHSFSSSGLLLLHRDTNGSDNQDGVWQQHCWGSLFNASLAASWSCGSSRTPDNRVKGKIPCVLPRGCIPRMLLHAQGDEVCTSLHQKAVDQKAVI